MDVEVSADGLIAKLEGASQATKTALVDALSPLAKEIAADARARAAAHIRFYGRKPGQYLASIYGAVSIKPRGVVGFVRSGDPLAHLLESGASRKAHEIDLDHVMEFTGDACTVYRRHVMIPANRSPALPAVGPAVEAAAGRIRDAIEAVAHRKG